MAAGLSGGPSKLSIRAVAKRYGPVTALGKASLELAEGEFLTLLGPSGSGKTTLLMIVAGLTQPSEGEVWIGGRLSTYAPPDKRDIGMVFQNYALFPHMTVAENVAFPLRRRAVPSAEVSERVTRALEMVQLGHAAARLPRELSGGQQQRIALARCMVYQPSIILMDEPLGALDRKLRDHMQMEIKQLHKQFGISVLYVTHDQDEAMAMSDRICLMNNGHIEQIGSPQDLYFRPATAFVADFLGESNIIPGHRRGDHTVELPGGLHVSATIAPGLATGAPIKLVLRPENLRLLPPDGLADNEAEGVLTETVFVGGVFRHFVALPGGTVVAVKQFSDAAMAVPARGSAVRVGWQQAHGVVLDAR